MVFVNLFPIGHPPALRRGGERLLARPRAIEFFEPRHGSHVEWLRLPGDVLFIVGGAAPAGLCCAGAGFALRTRIAPAASGYQYVCLLWRLQPASKRRASATGAAVECTVAHMVVGRQRAIGMRSNTVSIRRPRWQSGGFFNLLLRRSRAALEQLKG